MADAGGARAAGQGNLKAELSMETAAGQVAEARRLTLSGLAASARPKQWSKNLIVFGPIVFARDLLSGHLLARAILTFIAFCLVSSCVYLINDAIDVESDRRHPEKRLRPLAAGQITLPQALVEMVALGLLSLVAGFVVGWPVGLAVAGYLALMTAYSFVLKQLVLIDVFAIACGFIVRAVAGALAIHVSISPWLYLCTLLLALFLALSKRQNELATLQDGAAGHRKILDEYTPAMLDQMTSVVTASTIMAYSLYTFSAESLPANHAMMLTIPFVIYGIFRYQYLVHKKSLGGAPE
ncbi:MAG: decaprenyl-phosphate phosphoribosyltransferase, partial [Ktedonobacterales bacterium]|nr:decaprenyl-phosphate phosphoribosyltransferase [Ktedonobacterales bacterium]